MPDVEDYILLEHAEETLNEALRVLRGMTPEGWQRAHALALTAESRWNSYDVSMLGDARLLSMRGGPRFKPERET